MTPRSTGAAALPPRTPPAVTLHAASVADSDLLDDGSVDAVAVQVAPGRDGDDALQPRSGTPQAAARYGIDLAELAERAGLTGAAGEAFTVHLPLPVGSSVELPWAGLPPRIVLVGVGDEGPTALRRAGAALARATRGLTRVAATVGAQTHHDEAGAAQAARAVAEGYLLAAYRQPRTTRTPDDERPAELVLLGRDGAAVAAAVETARTGAEATWLVRDLANTPSSVKDPAWMADRARRLGSRAGLDVQVLGPRELAAGGFGGILAVGAGSASTPRLVRLTYTPAKGGGRHVVVVGKGITYDTGGLSIKPREAMVPMKTDMAGSAVALATVLAAARAQVPHRVTAVLPLAENHVGAASYRPGDVVTIHGGTTVEIANTDAEGRLVLADALAWADATLEPDVLVDVATLTGAATLGLGRQHAALYGTDDALVAALTEAGRRTGELVWHMPLVADYEEAVRSSVADLRHVPEDRRIGGGSITAALFLRRFVGQRAWAHLDIAGTGRSTSDKHEVTEGATGYGARLLLEYLAALD
ncbi:Leucyl aminopeptidase [Cellulomonas flavigena DSM 20109]|uniref:Probable cytosol aminopeptidase n=1 Tax=Cellulomonas flavigena (strain ATCC 482 / DSM 20109 / BCRC 11376 / JCM 18109 / NBRC 3775 / NCIMB 8073 / NRS 134) TaxID=446466 RepID=D5UKU2_CELFN|nr:leucyl aminopeptidase family protein [Cellulomonas flavigena]ADG73910.1 Leucyl aminopeptidase [Cellulomonas flavigena DSM 20109]